MTKKNQDKEPGLLTWEVRENEIVFSLSEWRIRIPKDEYLTLIDPRSMFERFQEATPVNAGFAALDNVETYARIYRYLKKGLILEQVAQLLGVPGEVLRRFWSFAMTRYPGGAATDAEIARQGADAEGKDYCKAIGIQTIGANAGQPNPPVFVDAYVAKKSLGAWNAAETLGLDNRDFDEWLRKNKAILDIL